MTDSNVLRLRAARCREIAKDYHVSLTADLHQQADLLEREADRLDRSLFKPVGEPLLVAHM